MTDAIITFTIENHEDHSYLDRIATWLLEIESSLTSFIKESLKEGLIQNFLNSIKSIISNINKPSSELLFKILEQLFSLKSVQEENSNFLQMLENKDMLYSEINNVMCYSLIRKILLLDSQTNIIHYKGILKKTPTSDVLINFLEILLDSIKHSDTCKRYFLGCGILFVLKDKINPEYLKAKEFTVKLWEVIIKIIRVLLSSKYISLKNIEDIDFNSLAEFLSNSSNKGYFEEISVKCIEDIEYILYGDTIAEHRNTIMIPQTVPLIFQILTSSSQDIKLEHARNRIKQQLQTEIGISYMAYYNAFDIILKYFLITTTLDFSDFFEGVIAKIIPFHIPPQALAKLLSIVKTTTNSKKKLILLQALEQAISNSNCTENMLTPTHYFYFHPESFLEYQCNQNDIPSQNQHQISVLF